MSTIDLTAAALRRARAPVVFDIDELIQTAKEEAEVIPRHRSPYKAAWYLARIFKDYAGEVQYLYPAVEAFCRHQGRHVPDFNIHFCRALDKVRYGVGEDPLHVAWVAAEREPYPCRDPAYGQFVSTIYHLSRESPDRTFYVARKRLRELSGLSSTAVTYCLRYATDEGLIECVDDDYAFHPGKGGRSKCKTYRFIGPALPSDHPADAAAGTPGDSTDDAYDDAEQFDDRPQPCLVD